MRVVTMIGVLVTTGAATLSAQHHFQFEIGGFGTYTRFDRGFNLENQFGGGGRLGLWITDWLSIEGDGLYMRPHPKGGGADFPVWFGAGSIVLNFGPDKSFYVLGGYSAMDFNSSGTGGFRDVGAHGGIGDRIYLSDRAALRLEARAYYAPNTQMLGGGGWAGQVVGSAGLSFFLGPSHRETTPSIPKERRDSIVAAGGQLPEAPRPEPIYEAGPSGHALQFEIGGFATYTRFDRAFNLENQLGGGARLGLWITDWLSIEGDGLYMRPRSKAGGADFPAWFGSGSILLNFGPEKSFYVLGGYSATDLNSSGGGFRDVGVHGGIGDRIYVSNRAALRLEARAYYDPHTNFPGGTWSGQVVGSAGLSFFLGRGRREKVYPPIPKERRDSIIAAGGQVPEARPHPGPAYERRSSDWTNKWYWGGQGGLFVFRTNFDSYAFEPVFGGHWLITGKRTAMYVAFEQSFFLSERHATIALPDGTVEPGNVSFKDARRILAGVLAFPAQLRVEPFFGGGFALVELLNPVASCSSCSSGVAAELQNQAEDAASKAFFWWMGGVDIKQGRMALYGHYIVTSSAATFLIQGTTHSFQGGVRYILGNSKEGVTDRY